MVKRRTNITKGTIRGKGIFIWMCCKCGNIAIYIYITTRGILHELHKKFSENLARGSSFPNQELQRTQSSLRSHNRKSPAYMERF